MQLQFFLEMAKRVIRDRTSEYFLTTNDSNNASFVISTVVFSVATSLLAVDFIRLIF